jgi:hypothetical protein
MIQKTLFDQPPKRARSKDPDTSHEAAKDIDSKCGLLRNACLQILRSNWRAMTANEIADEAVSHYGGDDQSYRKRMHELVRDKIVIECDKRPCTVTGKRAKTYKLKERP